MTSTTTMSENAGRHALGDRELARESLLHCFQLPELGLSGTFYTWVDAQHRAGYAAWVYGGEADGSAIFEFHDGIEVDAGLGFDAWQAGPMRMSQRPDGDVATIAYDGDRIAVEFEFRPMHDAYLYSRSPAGCPAYFGDDRLEQSGHVRGTLRFDGREIPFDTQGHHDHSWGIRDWPMVQHYKWIEAQAGASAVHVFELNALGERPLIGYVYRDGVLSGVRTATWDVTYDAERFQRTVEVRVTDEADRETTLTGTSYARFEFPVNPGATLLDTMMSVEIEGRQGAAFSDFLWAPPYLEHMRAAGV